MKHLQMKAAVLGASTTQTQLLQHFGPVFEETKAISEFLPCVPMWEKAKFFHFCVVKVPLHVPFL